MYVKYMLLIGAFASGGCSKPADKKPIHLDIEFPDATPVIAADPTPAEYVALAKNAIDTVKVLASKCVLDGYEDTGFTVLVDDCGVWKAADVVAVTKARKALDASKLMPETGFAPTLVTQIDAFDDWSSKLPKNEQGYWAQRWTGTLSKYQEMATTWNDWRPPTDAVPVDVGQMKGAKVDAGASGKLPWKSCTRGPCISFDNDKKPMNR